MPVLVAQMGTLIGGYNLEGDAAPCAGAGQAGLEMCVTFRQCEQDEGRRRGA